MGINKKLIEKYEKAYSGLPEIRGAIDFEPTSPYYHMEEWRDVLPRYVPGVLENAYKISTHGRVYSNLKSTINPNGGIKAHSINQRGYHQIDLKTVDGGRICIKIARLVLLHFRFIPGCHLMEADHLDGDKDHNFLWNLEWVSPQENTHRAIINGQRAISNNSVMYNDYPFRFLSNQEAEMLFRELYECRRDNNYDFEEICLRYNISREFASGLLRGSIRPYIKESLLPILENQN